MQLSHIITIVISCSLIDMCTTLATGYSQRVVNVPLRGSVSSVSPAVPVPVSIWSPSESENAISGYDYQIDIRSIVRLLIGLPLPSFDFLRKTTLIKVRVEKERRLGQSDSKIIIPPFYIANNPSRARFARIAFQCG